MKNQAVRVRFAPSPTGGLHLGGVRTILFNYLFAKHHNGTFVLRIEDTDRKRFVESAEDYIFDCLDWTGLTPDESVRHGGAYGPYRQSERKGMYAKYAQQLVEQGNAYYAFDTPEELDNMRQQFKTKECPSPQYDKRTRMKMRNSLTLSEEAVQALINEGSPYVIRLKVPADETVSFHDMIRGTVTNDANLVDDKVILKGDGMPTYHLAVVVDDYLMKISHAFRGEEWLPSAPIHILLWRYLGWEAQMPEWGHLPLILKPDGNGKLSKRDGERLGFPVFAMEWNDTATGLVTEGFKEKGFLPEAFVNLLAVLGWNDGTEQEVFSLEELIEKFSMERVHKGGAKFDYEKAKWYNQQHLLKKDNESLLALVRPYFQAEAIDGVADEQLLSAIGMVKERCQLLPDFVKQAGFLFRQPTEIDVDSIKKGWDDVRADFFKAYAAQLDSSLSVEELEVSFAKLAEEHGIKKGKVMLPLRVMLVGGKFGPGVFDILKFIGGDAAKQRIDHALGLMK